MDDSKLELIKIALEIQNRKYAKDCFLWAKECVYTQDEATQAKLPFPADMGYIEDLIWAFQNLQKIVVPKSRRMFVSWAAATYCLWKTRFHPYNAIYWQSLQEAKAAYMIDQRIKFIEDNLKPINKKQYDAVRTTVGLVGKITFVDTKSYVLAIPQGDDQIRSFTPSVLVCDEIDIQPEGQSAVDAALSTVEKNSQIILITTSMGPGHPVADICRSSGYMSFPQFYGKSMIGA